MFQTYAVSISITYGWPGYLVVVKYVSKCPQTPSARSRKEIPERGHICMYSISPIIFHYSLRYIGIFAYAHMVSPNQYLSYQPVNMTRKRK
ncbi:hypothetical protein F4809DRAFT_631127 [Biscogniauxia mediterranea]|nr:hypothetical protein F4809DRAFT_631127 [Biscogniauxia mediterranea]